MYDVFHRLLKEAIKCGLGIMEFWDLTYEEIVLYINTYAEQEKEKLKERALLDYKLADLIGISAGRLLDSKVEFPQIHTAYPSLFSPVESEPDVPAWQETKAKLMKFAQGRNKALAKNKRRGNINDN